VNNTPPPKSASGFGTVVKYVVGSGVFVAVVAFAYKAATKRNDNKRF
jgi:cbb3-type cytochrome oxidase subunit 3